MSVLLVEDDPDDAELIGYALADEGAFRIRVVDTMAALEQALLSPTDVVLTDCNLPGMDVLDVLGRVRARHPAPPVIAISGALDDAQSTALLGHGACDVLLKDRLGRLGQAVRTALRARALADEASQARDRERRMVALLSGLLSSSTAAIGVYDGSGGRLLGNARFDDLIAAGLTAQRVSTLLPTRHPTEVEIGARVHLASAFAIEDTSGPGARALLLTDITAQKRVETELLATQARLRARSREVQQSNAELLELDRLKNDLISTVSHELRTPLTSIIGYVELLAEQLRTGSARDPLPMLEVVERNSRRLLDLVTNLLQLAEMDRAPNGADGAAPEQVAVETVVASVCEMLLPQALAARLRLVAEHEPELGTVEGNAAQLERALLNVCSNAVKFSRPGGTVTVRTRGGADQVRIDVVDEGVGIEQADLDRLGEKFFRTESARSARIQGTGLGLAVARTIVQRHGGTLALRSRPGQGTTVSIRLPAPRRG